MTAISTRTLDGVEAAAVTQRIWDVVVVGAGPAGASAATAAAVRGARTLLIDRAKLPRYKTCGGGLVGASLRALPAPVTIPLRDTINAATFTYRGRYARTYRQDRELLKMVYRDEFDDFLVRAAKAAGVAICDATLVKSIEVNDEAITVLTNQGAVRGRAVIGCDGSASKIGRYVGVECSQIDLGLELELDATSVKGAWAGRVHLDWGPLPGSYGWVFPKGDSLTVGVIAAKGQGEATKQYLEKFVRDLHLQQCPILRDSGHLTRCRSEGSPLARGRVLVAGDAAGLVEPWTREGISFALRSGQLAGNTAAHMAKLRSGTVVHLSAQYESSIEQQLVPEMRAGGAFMRAFSKRPWLFHAAIGVVPTGWEAFVSITSGEKTFDETLGRWPLPSLLKLAAVDLSSLALSGNFNGRLRKLLGRERRGGGV